MTKSPCILLVEDDENDVYFFERAAKQSEILESLKVVRDGQSAIDYLSGGGEFSDRVRFPIPCLIVLDLKMPRKTGMEVLEWLRADASLRTIPVIVFSSSAQGDDVEQAYRLGANAFVVKPAALAKRNEFVQLLKGFWLDWNLPPARCEWARGDIKAESGWTGPFRPYDK